MSKRITALICLSACVGWIGAEHVHADDVKPPTLRVGQHAPEIVLHRLLHAPDGAAVSREALKGQVVVLEFWATWCKGCIEAIPHMNELATRFADKPIRFIAVTAEDEAKVQKFLEKRPIKGWIGLDSGRSTSRAFEAVMIPRTVLIDGEGKVAGITSPEQLTEEHLHAVLARKPVEFKPEAAVYLEEYIEEALQHDVIPERERLFELSIQPVKPSKQARGTGTPGDFVVEAAKLKHALALAYQVPREKIRGSIPILEQTFYIRHVTKMLPPDRAMRMLQESLCAALGITVQKEVHDVESYALKLVGDPGPGLKPPSAESECRFEGNTIHAADRSLKCLALWIESRINSPVADETGMTRHFDFVFTWDPENSQKSIRELETQFGLQLVIRRKPVEFLVVRYAPDP